MNEKENYEKQHRERIGSLEKNLCINIIAQRYDYESFGSWLFTFKNENGEYQIVFDGREYYLELSKSEGTQQKTITSKTRREAYRDPEILFQDVAEIINKNA